MKTKIILFLAVVFSSLNAAGQQETYLYSAYFQKAYQQNPNVPHGVLEAVAFTMTRINHLDSSGPPSCMGIPRALGVMGLTLDGKGYFRNNLLIVARLSGYSISDIINKPEANILAFAAAYAKLKKEKGIEGNDVEKDIPVLKALSELPDKENDFALNSHIYSVLSFLNDSNNQQRYGFPNYKINLVKVFGEENYKVLTSPKITIEKDKITNEKGQEYHKNNSIWDRIKRFFQSKRSSNTKSIKGNFNSGLSSRINQPFPFFLSSDYAPALTNLAASCNYTVGRTQSISAVVIHETDGSYAGSISWFQNCSAQVSAHYVIRSSDGQVTQMVYEANKAWHIGSENPYTIGIEHEGYCNQTGWYTTAMYCSSADLVRDICNSGYGISPTSCYSGSACTCNESSSTCLKSSSIKIKGHQMFPNQTHSDPGPYWDWAYYYGLVNGAGCNPCTPPANDACPGTTLTVGTSCGAGTAGTVSCATASGLSQASCDVYSGTPHLQDVWYSFTAATTGTYTITATPNSTFDVVLALYSGTCGALSAVPNGCADSGGGPGAAETVSISLNAGTYRIRVYDYGNIAPSDGSFTICVYTSGGSCTSNDYCSCATSLTPSATCNPISGTVAGATQSYPAITCNGFTGTADEDVWYSFTATNATATVTVGGSASFDAVVEAFSNVCDAASSFSCADGTSAGATETMNLTGLNPGSTYYLRVYEYHAGVQATTTFTICVVSPSPPNCTNWTVAPTSQNVPATGGSYTDTVSAVGSNCNYTLTFNDGWLHFINYPGNGVFAYSVDNNPSCNPRTGTISVNNDADGISNVAVLTITQAGLSAPSTPVISGSTSFCSGQWTTLTVSNPCSGCSYAWSNGQSANSIYVNAAGNYSVSVANSCGSTPSSIISVSENPLPNVSLTPFSNICIDHTPIQLSGATPAGGSFSGTGVAGNTFYPQNAGAGIFIISYAYSDGSGCSNSTAQTITVNSLPSIPIISQSGLVLTSSAATGNQWLLDGNAIAGATGQSFTISQNGNYTVMVTDSNGCTATSASYPVINVGNDENGNSDEISIFPNPNDGTFIFQLNRAMRESINIKIMNALGQIVLNEKYFLNGEQRIPVSLAEVAGLYIVRIQTNKGIISKCLMIE